MPKLNILSLSAAFATALAWSAAATAQPPSTVAPQAEAVHDRQSFSPLVALTPDERAWLAAHPDIALASAEGLEPEVIVDADGTKRGYLVDILAELNRRLGTAIRLDTGSVDEEVGKVKRREVAGALSIHPQYARNLGLLTTRTYYQVYPAAFTRQGVAFDRASDLAGKRVAVIQGVFHVQQLLNRYGAQATVVKVKTGLEGLRSVARGESDVFLGRSTNAYLIAKYQLLGIVPGFYFSEDPVPGVIAVRPDWPVLASILDKGLASFGGGEIDATIARWVRAPLPTGVMPSAAEAAWLARHRRVRVRVQSFPPFAILGAQGPEGISVDFLKLVGERTGITFGFEVGTRPYPGAIEGPAALDSADVVLLTGRDPRWEGRVAVSPDYVSSPRVIFTRVESDFVSGIAELRGRTLAVPASGAVEQDLARRPERYAEIRVVKVADETAAVEAVSKGRADAYIGNLTVASYQILERGFSNLKVAAPSPLEDERFYFGSRSDWPELASLIEKALQSITAAERTAILSRYLSVRYEQGLRWSQVLPWAGGGLAAAALLLGGVLTWNRVLRRQVRQRTAKLEESEFVARSTFEEAAVGMAHVVPGGRFLRVNPRFCDMLGYSEAELLERGFPDITHPDDLEADLAIAPKLVAGEIESDVREKRYLRKDGTTVWAERSVAVARGRDGAAPWFVVAIQDIGARKQAEQAVLQYQRRLRELASQLARVEERERRIIAAELHDHVGQSLSAMRALLAAAQNENLGGGADVRLDEVSECLRQAIRDTRNIMSSLSDPTLDRLGLSAATSEWLHSVGARWNLDTRFGEEGEPRPLGPDTSAMLFRAVRELLSNVVKHARASSVSVGIHWMTASLEIVVQDDGVGMEYCSSEKRSRAEGGFGLFSIEERIADVGGSFTIAASPGRGVRATLTVPLEHE